jgi:hypothetical protein
MCSSSRGTADREVNGEFYSRMWQMARADSFEAREVEAA